MVSFTSLGGIALVALALAIVVGWRSDLTRKQASGDAAAALLGTLAALALAVACYGIPWRGPGSWALLAGPLTATVALRVRGKRSAPRALIASVVVLALVILWLTLNFRGPAGGWKPGQVVLTTSASAVAIASAACLGWWSKRTRDRRPRPRGRARVSRRVPYVTLAVLLGLALVGCGPTGTLELTIVDASGEATPARIELRDPAGVAIVPDDSLPVFGDCGQLPLHNWVPAIANFQVLRGRARAIHNPFTDSSQFYSDGSTVTHLAPGRYSVTAFKGIEHEVGRAEVEIVGGATERLRLELVRWIDLPATGWYGADDHLHIPRPHPRFDPAIATWMQAEDIHVANLLQMGLARDVHISPQHGFGEESIYRDGDTLVVAGQENPRTHVLGHSIVLGAREWIDFPADYLQYDRFWREAHEQGAVTGYAHWGRAGAEEGLALWGHRELIDFIEVLGFGLPYYERWYEVLNLGIRMAPTAGTDFPCSQSLPGRERFYARLGGPLDYRAWLEAVRLGRTFVTNGPVVELLVDGAQPGDQVRLSAPGTVNVDARVRFDPARDEVLRLELVRGGEVVLRADKGSTPGEIRLKGTLNVEQSSWLALRASGWKRGETEIRIRELLESMLILERRTNEDLLRELPSKPVKRPSAAHTAAVYVIVDGTPPIAEQPKAREVAEAWLERLDELRARFDRIEELTGFPGRGDGIDEPLLRANRDVLLRAIEAARQDHAF